MKISKFLMIDLDLLFDVFEVLKMLNFCCSAWMSGFIGSIVEVVPRNLGVGLSWWSGSEHGGRFFGCHIFCNIGSLHHLWPNRRGRGLLQMIFLPLELWCLVVGKVLCCPS